MMMHLVLMLMTLKILKNFKNKLMTLMMMEASFLVVMVVMLTNKVNTSIMSLFLTTSIFMVLDSTMGLSILISAGRNSSNIMSNFYMI